MERLGGWLHEVLEDLSKSMTTEMGRVRNASSVDSSDKSQNTYLGALDRRHFFGQDARTQLDTVYPEIFGSNSRGKMHFFVADKHQTFEEVKGVRL